MKAPSPAELLVALALAQAERMRQGGRGDEAERICRMVLKSHADAVPILNLLALLLGQRGERTEAESLLRRALAISPHDAALFNNLGNLLYKRGDIAGAEQAYRQAVARNDDYPEAHYNRGLMLHLLGQAEAALAAQEKAVALRPGYAEALTQKGALLSDLGRPGEALAVFDSALAANPRYFDALYYRGVALMALNRQDQAIAALEAALALRPQSIEARHALGNAFSYAGHESEALESYQAVIETAPTHVGAHIDYNALAWAMGRKDLHLKSFAYARGVVGQHPGLLLAESELHMRLDNPAAAEPLLRRARDIEPERGDILNAFGRALVGLGRFDEGIAVLQNAAALEPANPAHGREIGVAMLHDRKPQAAAAVLERAHALAPADQLTLGLLTLAWREAGDPRHGALTAMDHVGVYDLPPSPGFADSFSFNNALAQELTDLHTHKVEPHDQTLRGGTQTMGQLFTRPSRNIAALRERIDAAIADYIARMPDDPGHPLYGRRQSGFSYSGSWSCRLKSSGFHTNHVHPQGWISSAYYVALPEGMDDPHARPGWLSFGQSNLNLGARDRALHAVQPGVGRLVLFPSYFWHGTVPFQSDRVRLAVAFDVVPHSIG